MRENNISSGFEKLLNVFEQELEKLRKESQSAIGKTDEDEIIKILQERKRIKLFQDRTVSLYNSWKKGYNFSGNGPTLPKGDKILVLDGKEIHFRLAKEILLITAEWLIKKGHIKEKDCPISFGSKQYLINTIPEHPHRPFIQPKRLSNGYFVETNQSFNCSLRKARRLLQHFGYPSFLEIKKGEDF